MNDTFGLAQIKADLTLDEGVRVKPYTDSRGLITIAVGRNLSDHGLSPDEVDLLLTNDINAVCDGLDDNMPWWRVLPQAKQRVVLNLAFNMGVGTLLTFPVFLGCMMRWDWAAAAVALEDSRWWHQVGDRGPRMVGRLTNE